MHLTNEAKVLTGIVVVTIAILIGAVFFLSKPEKPVIVDTTKLVNADSNKLSSNSAKLTIVEFGDYQCPACGAAHTPLKQAISEFPGQVNFVFRHFPLTQHRNAEIAARAVEAAKIQGKLWEMHDKLYDAQAEWSEQGNPMEFFQKYATELGMDLNQFNKDINSDAVKQKVQNDLADGLALNVNSTPTLYFNDQQYKGGFGYEALKAEIESKLK